MDRRKFINLSGLGITSFSIPNFIQSTIPTSSIQPIVASTWDAGLRANVAAWDILKNGVVVARLSSTEWELYRNHLTREISVVTSFSSDEDMKEVLRFVHTKFPNDKIEINEDDGNSFPKN